MIINMLQKKGNKITKIAVLFLIAIQSINSHCALAYSRSTYHPHIRRSYTHSHSHNNNSEFYTFLIYLFSFAVIFVLIQLVIERFIINKKTNLTKPVNNINVTNYKKKRRKKKKKKIQQTFNNDS
ncbi:hypothetical protein C7375_11324 [Frischella perrara]|uniref:Uncharacterized protein n=1 Tax=Frischella perrara TaxID=1267021 RepID=A0A0A7S6R3_FRIPE|nr:hypothetical protein FPB0191_01082 [Frischella perrara]PWV59382.1 hypothetical protein C7375_11324 [Frischella perrara]